MSEGASRYVVRRLRWTEPGFSGHMQAYRRRLPAAIDVASFDDHSAARAECRRLELAARRGLNPFALGGGALFHQTSLDSGRLHDWLLDHEVTHPPGRFNWRTWFYNASAILSPAQVMAVWDALDKVRFYDVVERPTRVAHAALRFTWKAGVGVGRPLPSDCEGGNLHKAYQSAASAEVARSELNQRARQEERANIADGVNYSHFVVERLSGDWPEGQLTVDEVPFAEVVEVPLVDDIRGPGCFLVQRRAFDPEGCFCRNENGDPTEAVVPLSLHATRDAAEAEARRLEAEARHLVSPFAFFPPHNDLAALSSLPFDQFQAEARRLKLFPDHRGKDALVNLGGVWMDFNPDVWLTLWDECVDNMSDQQREAVWRLLDRLSFHQVVEVELGE
jgi:hypothetical protein